MTTHLDKLKPLWNGFAYERHQTYGIDWMMRREEVEESRGGFLCDEMGLGKTIQIVGLLKSQPLNHNILFCPLAVLEQWNDTATRAQINCWRAGSNGKWVPPAKLHLKQPHLYLINYEAATSKPDLLEKKEWNRVICDEAHRLASGGRAYQLIAAVKCPIHWLLTATPIVNSMKDIKNLFQLVGTEYEPAKLGQFMLARNMDELRDRLTHLPAKAQQITHALDFESEDEAEFYRGVQGMLVRRWKALKEDGDATALDRLKLIMKLRQISLHPQVYIEGRKRASVEGIYSRPDWIEPSTKFHAMLDLIEQETSARRWIVFCHFREEMRLLKEFLSISERIDKIWCYNGSCSQKERSDILRDTQTPLKEDKHQILLIQLQSGGVGLNLQHFSRIVFSGPWWTSALMEQAIGRAVRIGQTEQVLVHHLILKEEEGLNIDRMMNEKAAFKGALCRFILSKADHSIL